MSKFRPLSFYEESLKTGYKLLPFQFTRLEGDEYLVSNLVGEFVTLDRPTLEHFARHTLATTRYRTVSKLPGRGILYIFHRDNGNEYLASVRTLKP